MATETAETHLLLYRRRAGGSTFRLTVEDLLR